MPKAKRILICPLDWGLGHATRCVPIIRLLLEKGAEVIIAADGRPLELLKKEFPQLTFVVFKGYNIQYPESGSMTFKMILSVPKILKGIKREHQELEDLVEKHQIDVVISDNRYGCHTKKAKSIFMTHQLMIKAPIAEKSLHKIVLKYIKKYDECWVPDVKGTENLSGDLSHSMSLPENIFFVGALSRFKKENNTSPQFDILGIVSGPEPQRSIFEKILTDQFSKSNLKAMLVLGIPEENKKKEMGQTTIISHLNADEMQTAILNSKLIIARSGYSTIMDLSVLGKKAVFIPTPGQTEQEYLAALFTKKGIAYSLKQNEFDLANAIKESGNYKGFEGIGGNELLEKRIDILMK